MQHRLLHLYKYMNSFYEEFKDEIISLPNNNQRINLLLEQLERDIQSVTFYKKQLYDLDEECRMAGITCTE